VMRRGWLDDHPPSAIKIIDRARGTSISYHNRLWPLAQPFVGKYVEPYAIKVEHIADDQLRFIAHHHEEFVFVLQGHIECLIKTPDGLASEKLGAGDCMYFWSYLPHVNRSLGPEPGFSLHLVHSPHEPADSELYNGHSGGMYLIDASHKNVMEQIVGRITSTRQRHGLSLSECARALAISVRRLKNIERGEAPLSIELLLRICRTFRKPRDYFLASTLIERPFSQVTHAAEIESAAPQNESDSTDIANSFHNATFKPLATSFPRRGMHPYLIRLQKADLGQARLTSSPGQQFVYVLNGAVRLQTNRDGEQFEETLFAGDSCFIDTSFPHRFLDASFHPYESKGSEVVAVVWSARQLDRRSSATTSCEESDRSWPLRAAHPGNSTS